MIYLSLGWSNINRKYRMIQETIFLWIMTKLSQQCKMGTQRSRTCRIPLASISNVTSICGTPRGAGGIPVKSNLPSGWLSFVIGRSPSNTWIRIQIQLVQALDHRKEGNVELEAQRTWIVTVCWLSEAVEKIWDFFVGITVFLGINLVMTPPTVSIPIVRGFTSRRTIASVSCSPDRTPAWTAAPYATASSGLIPRLGSLPLKNSLTNCWT